MAHIPLNDPELALAELRRCLKLGFRGSSWRPSRCIGVAAPPTRSSTRIWHEMEDAGLPLCLHVIVRFNRIVENAARFSSLLIEPSRTLRLRPRRTFQIIPAMSSLIMTGFFDRFPRLKCLCVEAGAGWAAYIAHRLDEKYEMFGYTERNEARTERLHAPQCLVRRRAARNRTRLHDG